MISKRETKAMPLFGFSIQHIAFCVQGMDNSTSQRIVVLGKAG